jgi:hypothetical protein
VPPRWRDSVAEAQSFGLRSRRDDVEIYFYFTRDSAETVGFREERSTDPALFFSGKRAVPKFVRADFEPANSGDPRQFTLGHSERPSVGSQFVHTTAIVDSLRAT